MSNRAFREYLLRLWWTFRRGRTDRDVEDEFRLHLELAAEDARRRGDSPDDAMRGARLRSGTIPQALEAMRDQRGLPWLEDAGRDVRYALHALRRNPGFALVAVLTLALGIGANSAIFSIVNAVLLRPLPYGDPDRLVSAGQMLAGEYLFFRDHARSASEIALYRGSVGLNLSNGAEAERLTGALVSANFFSVLGISAARGRAFFPVEEQPGESRVVVLSHALWRQRFGAEPSVIGRDI